MLLVDALRTEAEKHYSQYPQYTGTFNNWIVARAQRAVKFKGGVGLQKGAVYLMSPNRFGVWPREQEKTHTTVFVPECGICCVKIQDMERL